MGLRNDFLVHKRKTVESFRFVRADILNTNINIENIKNMLASLESRISAFDSQILEIKQAIDKCSSDVKLQQSNKLTLWSKIEHVNKFMENSVNTLNSCQNKISKIISKNQKLSKKVTSNNNSIKKLLSRLKTHSLKSRKLSSALKQSQEETQKLRNFFNRKLRTLKIRNTEFETRFKNQRRTILTLNKKIKALS